MFNKKIVIWGVWYVNGDYKFIIYYLSVKLKLLV